MKKFSVLLLMVLLFVLSAGCAGKKTSEDGPKPWAAPSTSATAPQPQTEWTKSAEMPTLAELETQSGGITLPQGITAADIRQLEQALWMQFFYTAFEPQPVATAQDVLPYLTNGAVPWGVFYMYDAFDPAHTHGGYEKLSVTDTPDPRGIFPDEYYKVDRSVLQFLFADVFGVRPDWTFSTEDYYCEGEYGYFICLPTGLEGYETHIRACQTLAEGQYRVTAELLIADGEDSFSHAASAFVDVAAVEQDGLRFFSVSRVEPFE